MYVPSHVLVDPLKLCCGSTLAFTAFPSIQAWMVPFACLAVWLWIRDNTTVNYNRALKRNLTVKKRDVSSNMPTLLAHVRQLAAAGRIIQDHIYESRNQPAASPAASVSSSLALMHALKHHAAITRHLLMRLKAACLTCMQPRRGTAETWERRVDADISNGNVDSIETLMETRPYI